MRELRAAIEGEVLPLPLESSPRCNGCSLAGICLPDELGLLTGRTGDPEAEPEDKLQRRLLPARDDATPVHVVTQGARVGITGEELVVRRGREELGRASLPLISHVALHGGVQISTQALSRLMQRGTPVGFFTMGGWFHGLAMGLPHGNILLRQRQYAAAADEAQSLVFARRVVVSKLRNQRTLLRRNHRAPHDKTPQTETEGDAPQVTLDKALRAIAEAGKQAAQAERLDQLMGCEGIGARAYFGAFAGMLAEQPRALGFDFQGRNRRPPADPVNAALSFAYALLSREYTHTLLRVGLEPLLGFLHQPRHGRPALALDLMEEFRPLIADSTVLRAFNNGELRPMDFITRGNACSLTANGRKRLIATYERRLDGLVTHPVFGYRISYRRVLEVQARLLARTLLGELDRWPGFEVR